jgi:hypothetical protein
MNRFFISWQYCLTLIMAVLIAGCSSISETQAVEITPTPTITPVPEVAPSITPVASACEGLSGTLEVMILAGPAEVVGLEPYTIGHIPFMVESQDGINIVQGGGPISYADILVEEWGTYEVTLDFSTSIEGICSGVAGAEKLQLDLLMGGDQNVIVEAEGFSGEYPWAGEIKRELEFPLVNGASNEGEGWAVVLHLNTK